MDVCEKVAQRVILLMETQNGRIIGNTVRSFGSYTSRRRTNMKAKGFWNDLYNLTFDGNVILDC
jgi:hypothetical protein